MFDVTRVLYCFCDPEVRREAELTLVEDYRQLLTDAMAKEGRTLDLTLEQVRFEHFT